MNNEGRRAVSAVVSGVIAGLVIGLIVFVVSMLIPTVHLPAAVIGFWAGVLVAVVSFFNGWNSRNRV